MRRLVCILGPAAGLLACTQPREPATVDSVALPPVLETTSSSPGRNPAAVVVDTAAVADTMVRIVEDPVDAGPFRSIYEKPFKDTLTLSVAIRWRDAKNYAEPELRVSLIPRQRDKQAWIIAQRHDRDVETYEVLRTDDSSVVIGRRGFYASMASLKLFLHPQSKSVVKQIDYAPDIGLTAVGDTEVARLLDVSPEIVEQLKKKPWPEVRDPTRIPAELWKHPMPQSTYDEFARARPVRVTNGYTRDDTVLEEEPGPYQIAGSRIWFGKTFYDGEGTSGVGGLGYFDTTTSQYAFLPVSDWPTGPYQRFLSRRTPPGSDSSLTPKENPMPEDSFATSLDPARALGSLPRKWSITLFAGRIGSMSPPRMGRTWCRKTGW
jgi:hypothetical protein